MANWYLFRNGQAYGPYAEEQFRDWIAAGQLVAGEHVCREGEQTWIPVETVSEFASLLAAAPAPVEPPATPHAPLQNPYPLPPGAYASLPPGTKDRTVAGILAILLGTFGVHHFYLGNIGLGVLYLILSCTSLPTLLGVIEGIIYLTKPEAEFQRNYHRWFCAGS